MSCGRRVVHSLVAATLVAHWPQDGGASLPFPPLTLTPGADLRGGGRVLGKLLQRARMGLEGEE